MSYARPMPATHPRTFNVHADLLAAAIAALGDCAQARNPDNAADLSAYMPAASRRRPGAPGTPGPGPAPWPLAP